MGACENSHLNIVLTKEQYSVTIVIVVYLFLSSSYYTIIFIHRRIKTKNSFPLNIKFVSAHRNTKM